MHAGRADREGTARLAARHVEAVENGFYRQGQDLTLGSLGIGTYLGPMDAATDVAYTAAVEAAVRGGVNVIDTSLNYRHQRSERAVGAALQRLFAQGVARDEVVLCTKAGYLVPDAVPLGALREGDVVGGMHSMAPAFLASQLERSLHNLGVASVDVFYLHNPETQLRYVGRGDFLGRVRRAFEKLEELAASGRLQFYGMATWDGFRRAAGDGGRLHLGELAGLAEDVGGRAHRFRFIQLPFNLAMVEAYGLRAETADGAASNVLDAASARGITVVASAALLQARLAREMPEALTARLAGGTNAQRAIQFARSAPGVSVALAAMSGTAHVAENLGVARFPPADENTFRGLFE